MKKAKLLIGVLAMMMLAVPLFVAAAPGGAPPTGAVSPFFSGLNIGSGGGGFYITRFSVDGSTGALSSPTGAVTINDTDGLSSNGQIVANNDYVQATDGTNYATLFSNGTISAADSSGHYTALYPVGGLWLEGSGFGGATLDNVGAGGLTINTTTGGLFVNASAGGGIRLNTSGGIINDGGSVNVNDSLRVSSSITGSSHLFLSGTAYLNGGMQLSGSHNLKTYTYSPSIFFPFSCSGGNAKVVTAVDFGASTVTYRCVGITAS